LQEFDFDVQKRKIKLTAKDTGNCVDWGGIKDGIYENDLKCVDYTSRARVEQEQREKDKFRIKPRFIGFN
jgi:hypothetical protein